MNNFYKRILIIPAFIFLYVSYASAKDIKPEKEESLTHLQNEISDQKDHYISFDIGITTSFSPLSQLMKIKYGKYFSQRAFFEIGFSFRPYTQTRTIFYLQSGNGKFCTIKKEDFNHFLPFMDITYGYDFIADGKWIPGIDTSLFIKPLSFSEEYTEIMVSGGVELGLYLKAFISESYSVFLRPGLIFDSENIIDFYDYGAIAFLNLGFQGHF